MRLGLTRAYNFPAGYSGHYYVIKRRRLFASTEWSFSGYRSRLSLLEDCYPPTSVSSNYPRGDYGTRLLELPGVAPEDQVCPILVTFLTVSGPITILIKFRRESPRAISSFGRDSFKPGPSGTYGLNF